MFKHAWDTRLSQAKDVSLSAKCQIAEAEKQIETLLGRIMNATNDAVIGIYENKIGVLEKTKVRLHDNLTLQTPAKASTTGRFDEMLELSLKFLSNPCKLWESGNLILRRTLLRLAFTEGFAYHRNDGARTPQLSLPFKALGVFQQGKNSNGAAGEN